MSLPETDLVGRRGYVAQILHGPDQPAQQDDNRATRIAMRVLTGLVLVGAAAAFTFGMPIIGAIAVVVALAILYKTPKALEAIAEKPLDLGRGRAPVAVKLVDDNTLPVEETTYIPIEQRVKVDPNLENDDFWKIDEKITFNVSPSRKTKEIHDGQHIGDTDDNSEAEDNDYFTPLPSHILNNPNHSYWQIVNTQ